MAPDLTPKGYTDLSELGGAGRSNLPIRTRRKNLVNTAAPGLSALTRRFVGGIRLIAAIGRPKVKRKE